MNKRLGKDRFLSFRITEDSGEISSIVLGNHTQKCNKKTQLVTWDTQGGDFQTTHTINVELKITELDTTKSVTCNFNI